MKIIIGLLLFAGASFGQTCQPGFDPILQKLTSCASVIPSTISANPIIVSFDTTGTPSATCTQGGVSCTGGITASATATTVVITHNYAIGTRLPLVTCGDASGSQFGGATISTIVETSTNVLTITFVASGTVIGTCTVARQTSGYVNYGANSYDATFAALTDNTTITWDASNALISNKTLLFTTHGGTRTLNLTNMINGGNYVLRVTQDGTGGEGLVLGSGCTWIPSSITLSSAAAGMDMVGFFYDGTNCLVIRQNLR